MKIFVVLATLFWALPVLADTATVVEGTRVNLRSGKSDAASVVKALEPGTQMEVLRQEQSYVHIKTEEGEVGWLPQRFVKITPTPKPANPKPPSNPPATEQKAEVENTQTQAAESASSPSTTETSSFGMYIGVGLAGLLLGVLLGVGGLQAYYRKKLNGLRI